MANANSTARVAQKKRCTKCGRKKPFREFAPNKRMRLGIQSACRACCNALAKAARQNPEYRAKRALENKRWRDANRNRISDYMKRRYRRNKKAILAKQHRWQRENANYIRAKQLEYYRQNKEDHRRRAAEWLLKNPDKAKAMSAAKRARRRHVTVITLTADQWRDIKRKATWRCVYCGKRRRLTQDHFIPLRDHGEHRPGNVVPACRPCNSSKGARRWNVLPEFRSLVHE